MCSNFRVPTHPGKSWIFPKISRTWKVLENEFGLDSPGNYSLRSCKVVDFTCGSDPGGFIGFGRTPLKGRKKNNLMALIRG